VPRRPDHSPQTRAVFALLAGDTTSWWYGYDIAQRTGLRSGTLYPILARLAERGYLATKWEEDPPEGRPRRHLYQLTGDGVARAADVAGVEARKTVIRTRPALGGAS
jgi:PadR family transcriptional regulator, regulatory protein PadR